MKPDVFARECVFSGLCPTCLNIGESNDHDLALVGAEKMRCQNCGREFDLKEIEEEAKKESKEFAMSHDVLSNTMNCPKCHRRDLLKHDQNGPYFCGACGWERGLIPIRNTETKIGRNDQCPCGSGKKFKKCCQGNGKGKS